MHTNRLPIQLYNLSWLLISCCEPSKCKFKMSMLHWLCWQQLIKSLFIYKLICYIILCISMESRTVYFNLLSLLEPNKKYSISKDHQWSVWYPQSTNIKLTDVLEADGLTGIPGHTSVYSWIIRLITTNIGCVIKLFDEPF